MARHDQNKVFHFLGLVVLVFCMKGAAATEFKVGGSNGWTVPTLPDRPAYNEWAERNRFQVGDSLVFVYDSGKDSVLQVTKEDYDNCKTDKPLQTFKDGHDTIKLYESGTHYYISGNRARCLENEKMVVTVMAYRGSSNGASSTSIGGVQVFLGLLFSLVVCQFA